MASTSAAIAAAIAQAHQLSQSLDDAEGEEEIEGEPDEDDEDAEGEMEEEADSSGDARKSLVGDEDIRPEDWVRVIDEDEDEEEDGDATLDGDTMDLLEAYPLAGGKGKEPLSHAININGGVKRKGDGGG